MNGELKDFESFLTRGSTETAKILGMSYSNYATLKGGQRPLPRYIRVHIDTLKQLDAEVLNSVVRKRLARG